MQRLDVTASKSYPIEIWDSLSGLGAAFAAAGLQGKRAVIVTDTNVVDLYAATVRETVAPVLGAASVCVFPAGEASKTLDNIQSIYAHCFEQRLDRHSVIIALGGGVVGDMAGFVAATYLRGLAFVQIPTTLLSQVDSSVGGKTGVDFMEAKNMIGAFYQPDFVYINTQTLRTLPREQFVSGLGEVLKHGFLGDKAYLDYVAANRAAVFAQDPAVIAAVVYGSCKIKATVVNADEKEHGQRETLNLGHTFGHAIESYYRFRMPHGHCVGLGLCAALYLSYVKGDISRGDLDEAQALLAAFGLPVSLEPAADKERLLNLMLTDKKVRDGQIRLVLLSALGCAYTYKNATREECVAALAFLQEPKE